MERLIRAESKKTSMILYTAWGGTRKELLNADEIKINRVEIIKSNIEEDLK